MKRFKEKFGIGSVRTVTYFTARDGKGIVKNLNINSGRNLEDSFFIRVWHDLFKLLNIGLYKVSFQCPLLLLTLSELKKKKAFRI